MHKKILFFGVAVLMILSSIAVIAASDDSDAASYGSPDNPRTSVSLTWSQVHSNNYTEIYVVTGSSFSITHTSTYECWSLTDEQGFEEFSSAWGLTISSTGNLSGTLTGTGSTTVTYNDISGGIAIPSYVTVYIVQGSTPAGSYPQTLVLGDWDFMRYRIENYDSTYDTGWSNPIYSDTVVNVPNGYIIWFRWYGNSEYISDVNAYYIGNYATSLYGSPVDFYKQITSANTFYPSVKPVTITIYNTTPIGGAATAIVVGDSPLMGTFVYDVQQGTSDIITLPSNSTVELSADGYYPGEFDHWSVRSGSSSYSNPYNYSLGSYDRIIDVYWNVQPYTVNFNANGGSVSPASKTVYYGSTYGNLPVPTRQGYGFAGWYTEQTGGTQVTASTSVPWKSISQSTFSLYAHWTANTYTVNFDAATNHGTPNSTKTVTYGSTYGTLPTATSQISGYSFAGWFTSATGGTQVTASTTVPYSSSGTITLFAQFTQITHTVTIQASSGGTATIYENGNPTNTATAQSGGTATITVIEGNAVTMTATPDSSHHFVDWRSSISPATSILANPYSYSNVRANITFTANFGNGAERTITFDYWTNGGSGVSFASKTVINGQQYGELPIAIKEGMEFDGWYTLATGGTKILPTTTVSLSADQTLFAHFVNNPLSVTVTINYGSVMVTDGINTQTASAGEYATLTTTQSAVTVVANPGTGYNFNYWNYFWNGDTSSPGGYETDNPWELTLMGDVEIFGICSQTIISKPFYAYVNNSNYGSISDGLNVGSYIQGTVNVGDVVSISNNVITIGDVTITATPNAGHRFVSWTGVTNGQIVQNSDVNITFTANFSVPTDAVYWSNEMYNGRIDMVYNFPSSNAAEQIMKMDLYSGTVGSDLKTAWTKNGYSLEIHMTYPNTAQISVTLLHNGAPVPGYSKDLDLGKWQNYQLTIDTSKGTIYATPVRQFNSFMDYTLYESQQKIIIDFSSAVSNSTVYTIDHYRGSTGSQPVKFSVVSTQVFLETYGTVLNNPTINVYDYFPQYDSYRLNFYSFAIYGDSISLNGTTYPVVKGQITVSYVDDGDGKHYVPTGAPDENVKTKTMTLSNIYVTWDGLEGHCYLTFVDNRFTIDMGTYTHGNEIVSFGGMWYFTTFLYEPHITNVKELGDWETLPTLDKTQICLIFAGLCIVIGAALYVKHVSSIMDTAIIVLALVADLIIMGG